MKLYKYTPALLDPKTLEDTLIGRDIELDNLKRILKSASAGKSFSHAILVGPKGIGKSHLLRILYYSLRGEIKTKGLHAYKDKFIPVIFSEEEYPGNITKFIKLTLHYLSELEIVEIPSIPEGLIKPITLNVREKEVAFDYLKTFKKKTGKVLLLLVDNLNDIIERFTDEDQSSLREILMTCDSVLLIGSAPTLFDSIINHERPFYNFFETIWLKDLSFEDTGSLLKRYAELDERNDLIEKFKESEAKLKALHELAGGNPRLILSLYHIIAEGDITSVEETFLKLLDELSPYFRDRIRDLSEQQKEIIDIMAKAEGLLTPTEIAARCYIPVNVVLSQIKRLEKIGCIKIAKKLAKKVFYDFNERLFSLWRQMRVEAGRKRLGFIVKFLEVWFTKEELFTHLDKMLEEMRKISSFDNAKIYPDVDKLWYLKEALPEFKGINESCVACKLEDYDVALGIVDKISTATTNDDTIVNQLRCKYTLYMRLKNYNEAINACKKVIDIKPDMHEAWSYLGNAYIADENYGEAIEAFKKAVEIKPDMQENWHIWYSIGFAYFNLKRHDEAIDAYKKAISIKTDEHGIWVDLGNTYTELNRYEEAIESYKKAIEITPDCYEVWGNLGAIYENSKRYDEAIEAFKKAVEIKPDIQENWRIWFSLGNLYFEQRKYENAIYAYDKSVKIKPEDNCAWYKLGHVFLALQKFTNALEAFRKAGEIKHCDHYKHMKEFELWITHISLFIDYGTKNNIESSIKNFRESLNYLSYLTQEKDQVFESYAMAFKNIIEGKKIDVIKTALKEIEAAKQNDLLDFLSSYATLIKYLETRNNEIIDRLRHEERIVVEEMLRMLGDRLEGEPRKNKKRAMRKIGDL